MGGGSFGFVAVEGVDDWRGVPRDGNPGVELSWEGHDGGDQTNGAPEISVAMPRSARVARDPGVARRLGAAGAGRARRR